MLIAYLDDSGTDDQAEVVAIAGYGAQYRRRLPLPGPTRRFWIYTGRA